MKKFMLIIATAVVGWVPQLAFGDPTTGSSSTALTIAAAASGALLYKDQVDLYANPAKVAQAALDKYSPTGGKRRAGTELVYCPRAGKMVRVPVAAEMNADAEFNKDKVFRAN